MSILREQQIKEILDADNFINRIVMSRYGANIKDYQENIKPVEVLDKTLDNKNKDEIDNFVNYINKIYILLYSWETHPTELLKFFANEKEEGYKNFLQDINITKPFQIWEKLTNEYINPAINQVSRESIMNNLSQKLLSYLKKINEYLFNIIVDLAPTIAYQNDLIEEEELFYEFFKDRFKSRNEGLALPKTFNNSSNKERLTKINGIKILPDMIETLAFYKCVENAINTTKIQPLTKQEIAFEISSIVNKLYTKLDPHYRDFIVNEIKDEIKGVELPELSPYFTAGFNEFNRAYDELDALRGIGEAKEPEPEPEPAYIDPHHDPFAHLLPNFERERMMPEGVNPEDMPWWMQMYHYMNPAPPVERGAWQLPEGVGRGKPKKNIKYRTKSIKNKADSMQYDDKKNEMYSNYMNEY